MIKFDSSVTRLNDLCRRPDSNSPLGDIIQDNSVCRDSGTVPDGNVPGNDGAGVYIDVILDPWVF
jgi:hypothetical protein